MFSCEFCEIPKKTFSHRTPLLAASETCFSPRDFVTTFVFLIEKFNSTVFHKIYRSWKRTASVRLEFVGARFQVVGGILKHCINLLMFHYMHKKSTFLFALIYFRFVDFAYLNILLLCWFYVYPKRRKCRTHKMSCKILREFCDIFFTWHFVLHLCAGFNEFNFF